MSLPPQRLLAKRLSKPPDVVEDVQDWENHIVLRVPEDCIDKMNKIVIDESKSEELGIMLMTDMRHAQVRVGNRILSGKLLDLPCVNEVYKTFDKKHVYKVADLSQILVCSHETFNPSASSAPSTSSTQEPSSSTTVANDANDTKTAKREARQWQYPHGITPPMKSARRRRFRKTKKKKYMDAPEVEKELKRLLRADLEADSVRWEIVEDKKKENASSAGTGPVTETSLFGDTVSSSDEDSEVVDEADDKDD